MAHLHVTPFYPEHLLYLKVHAVQTDEYRALLSPAAAILLQSSVGVTGWDGATCVGCVGVFQHWPGRCEAWGLMSNVASKHVLGVLHMVKGVLDNYPSRRVEMTVKAHNRHGHKLARHLGF
jgi:hypothetical protein